MVHTGWMTEMHDGVGRILRHEIAATERCGEASHFFAHAHIYVRQVAAHILS